MAEIKLKVNVKELKELIEQIAYELNVTDNEDIYLNLKEKNNFLEFSDFGRNYNNGWKSE